MQVQSLESPAVRSVYIVLIIIPLSFSVPGIYSRSIPALSVAVAKNVLIEFLNNKKF